jgi:hypothetical protein
MSDLLIGPSILALAADVLSDEIWASLALCLALVVVLFVIESRRPGPALSERALLLGWGVPKEWGDRRRRDSSRPAPKNRQRRLFHTLAHLRLAHFGRASITNAGAGRHDATC